jgi:hypothetical protein
MRYEIDENALKAFISFLDKGYPPNLLLAIPELAKEESVRNSLLSALNTHPVGFRLMCAEVLEAIDDPLGLDHLVYNSLSYHPLLKDNQTYTIKREYVASRVANRFNDKHIELFIEDAIKTKGFHGSTLAHASSDMIVPKMLELLKSDWELRCFASYVLAYHGYDTGANILMDWALSSSYPFMPLRALMKLSDNKVIDFVDSFISSRMDTTDNKLKSFVLTPLSFNLALKKLTTTDEKENFLRSEYECRFDTIEIYNKEHDGSKVTRKVEPFVMLLSEFNKDIATKSLFLLQDILTDESEMFRKLLADKQQTAIKQLFKNANLCFDDILDARLKYFSGCISTNRLRGIHFTGFLEKDISFYKVPVKIYYDMDDYLNFSIEWILNPLRNSMTNYGYTIY